MTTNGMKLAMLALGGIGALTPDLEPRAIRAFDALDGLVFSGWDIARAKPTKHGGVTKDRTKVKAARKASRISRRKRK